MYSKFQSMIIVYIFNSIGNYKYMESKVPKFSSFLCNNFFEFEQYVKDHAYF